MDFELVIIILLLVLAGVTIYISLRKLPVAEKRAEVDIQAIFLEVNAKVQKSYGGIIDELRDQIDELVTMLDVQRGEFTLNLSSQKTIIEDLKIRLSDLAARNTDLTKRVESLETENKNLKAENVALTKRVEILEYENDCLKTENSQLRGGLTG